MIEIRKKDLVFAATILPAALAAAYIYFWRMPALERIEELKEKEISLVDEAAFPARLAALRREADAARRDLEAFKAAGPGESPMPRPPPASLAERQRVLFAHFTTHGMRIVSAKTAPQADDAIAGILNIATARSDATAIAIIAEGSYHALRETLEELDTSKEAVIPQSVAFSSTSPGRWEICVWL